MMVGECTVEVNPATATLEYCEMLRAAGVDRLSFGAQSFNAAELKVLERHHEPGDVKRSVEVARAAGIRRINLDLIYAIPGQDCARGTSRCRRRWKWGRRTCRATD
jgi:oxygen-independent coproporphyrinogen-3 oxidase